MKDTPGGEREIILDVDDNLISNNSKYRSIPRADVAELCIQAISLKENRAVDAVAKEPADGTNPTTDFVALFNGLTKNCDYSDMDNDEVLNALKKGVNVSA